MRHGGELLLISAGNAADTVADSWVVELWVVGISAGSAADTEADSWVAWLCLFC